MKKHTHNSVKVRTELFVLITLLILGAHGLNVFGNTFEKEAKTAKLKEVLRVIDTESEDYYFKYPNRLTVAEDHSFIVADNDQLLQFSASGAFVRNYFKYGQGPGEMISTTSFLLRKDRLIINDDGQTKVFEVDFNGNLLREFRYRSMGMKQLIFYSDGKYYFVEKIPPDTKGKLVIFDIDYQLFYMTWGEEKIEKLRKFPVKFMSLTSGENYFVGARAVLIIRPIDSNTFYFSHTPEYRVNRLNLKSNLIEKTISRPYSRLIVTKETRKYAHGGNFDKISIGGGRYHEVPVAKYHDDIQTFFKVQDNLWIITSTIDKEKGVLVDVFNNAGEYIRCFYINPPDYIHPLTMGRWISMIKDGYIFAIEQEDDDWSIAKYKVEIQ